MQDAAADVVFPDGRHAAGLLAELPWCAMPTQGEVAWAPDAGDFGDAGIHKADHRHR